MKTGGNKSPVIDGTKSSGTTKSPLKQGDPMKDFVEDDQREPDTCEHGATVCEVCAEKRVRNACLDAVLEKLIQLDNDMCYTKQVEPRWVERCLRDYINALRGKEGS